MYITREKFLSRTLIYGTQEGYVLDMCPVRVGPKRNLYIKRLVCLGGGTHSLGMFIVKSMLLK